MLLAGDVGGTKTLLGLFERSNPRPRPFAVRSYANAAFGGFGDILDAFARDLQQPFSVDVAVLGVAGPVIENRASLTNVAWQIDAKDLAARFAAPKAELLNDLEAMAYSIEVLAPEELAALQEGDADARGNAAVIAAGTGLGEATLHGEGQRYVPVPSEGGHADFAARSDREMDFVRMLRGLYGRAEVEHVLSGPGLLNLHRFTHNGETCVAVGGRPPEEYPAAITEAALNGRCTRCAEALSMFVNAYGAEAGNLALRSLATGGIFIGGGIAPKILRAMQEGAFMQAFLDKGPMTPLLSKVPVKVILNPDAGLLGAAVFAQNYAL